MTVPGPRRVLLVCLLALPALCSGCKEPYWAPKVPYDSAVGLYDKARISYQLDAGKLQVPISVVRVEGQLVYYQQIPSSVRSRTSIGRLEVEYPHPRGLKDFALARIRIESRYPEPAREASKDKATLGDQISQISSQLPVVGTMAKPPAEAEEVWELDIPRIQLDRIMFALNYARYFESGVKADGPVTLAARVDGHEVDKSWARVDELDALMLEVRTHGRLLSYHRSQSAEKLAEPPPGSIAAYQAYASGDVQQSLDSARFLAGGYNVPGLSANPAAGLGAGLANPQAMAARAAAKQARMARLPAVPMTPAMR